MNKGMEIYYLFPHTSMWLSTFLSVPRFSLRPSWILYVSLYMWTCTCVQVRKYKYITKQRETLWLILRLNQFVSLFTSVCETVIYNLGLQVSVGHYQVTLEYNTVNHIKTNIRRWRLFVYVSLPLSGISKSRWLGFFLTVFLLFPTTASNLPTNSVSLASLYVYSTGYNISTHSKIHLNLFMDNNLNMSTKF